MRSFTTDNFYANIRVKSCPRSFIISISHVWMDHFNIMDEDCLSVHFRAHIVFKLSSLPSLPSQQIALHHCKPGHPGHLISDTSSQQDNIQYVEWGVGTAGRKVYTHFLPVLSAGLFVRCERERERREMMFRLDEEDCQYGFDRDDAMAQDHSPDLEIFM